jgi:hypothetical protein
VKPTNRHRLTNSQQFYRNVYIAALTENYGNADSMNIVISNNIRAPYERVGCFHTCIGLPELPSRPVPSPARSNSVRRGPAGSGSGFRPSAASVGLIGSWVGIFRRGDI